MTRVDYLVLTRLASRVALTVAVVFAIIFLVENMNGWRNTHLTQIGGPLLGAAGSAVAAASWSIQTLPVTVLIGAIIGLLELRMRMELPVAGRLSKCCPLAVRSPFQINFLAV